MKPYDPATLEPKWLRRWEEDGLHRTDLERAQAKFYNLMEFPYPSAEGLHVGHVFTYCGADTYGRFMRMQGHNVFEPIGFDSFGIHTENFALKRGVHPALLTRATIEHYRERQMKRLGAMFDWSRQVVTSSPEYYRWTQWLFLQLYRAGLAVRKQAPVNWCPSCLTVLANEQVTDGSCERCDTAVEQRRLTQWFFRITAYVDRLLLGLDRLDWPETSKKLQRNWIGRSEGAEIDFAVPGHSRPVTAFTTRPDTLFGVSYLALAPEHPLASAVAAPARRMQVETYIEQARKRREFDRLTAAEKTGVFTGACAVHPATGEPLPIWVADYVLPGYGTGAVMGVPAHDQRDFEFATRHRLPVRQVIAGPAPVTDAAYTGAGQMVNSGPFDGTGSEAGRAAVISWLEARGRGRRRVTYRLRDWCISRQRYWGPPIPIIYCPQCGQLPVPASDLPVLLPAVADFRPLGTSRSPLSAVADFVHTRCPRCRGPAQRETDVSDTFLDSAWYFLRYPSAGYHQGPWAPAVTRRWLPVDMYMGGIEHVCMHHLYARFITMVLYDLGLLPFAEPFRRLRLHGLLIKDGKKMSKSRGNVVNPDDYVARYGADVFRSYLLFIGPYEADNDFSDRGIEGMSRFFGRVWRLVHRHPPQGGEVDLSPLYQAVKAVTADLRSLSYHTALARIMELVNWAAAARSWGQNQYREVVSTLVLLLAPFAPMFAEELWERLGRPYSVHRQAWPAYNEAALSARAVTIVVQVDGRVRDRFRAPPGLDAADVLARALSRPRVRARLAAGAPRAHYYVPDRLINLITTGGPGPECGPRPQ